MKAAEVRPGMALDMDGKLLLVVGLTQVKPGKGPAYSQLKMRDIQSGGITEKRFRGADELNKIELDRRDMEYLYSDNTGAVFMDMETYDQETIEKDVLGDDLKFCKPNTQITGLVYNNNVISIELPASVDLEITDTTPQIKGATATNQLKEATCETGLAVRVPPFITIGEIVKISTVTGDYMGRSNDK